MVGNSMYQYRGVMIPLGISTSVGQMAAGIQPILRALSSAESMLRVLMYE